jgi:hypothetical protein
VGEPGGSDDVAGLAEAVEDLRELRFSEQPEVEFMSATELATYVRESSFDEIDREQVGTEFAAFAKLGILPEGFDIDELLETTSGQVLGLYEPEDERLLVGSTGELEPPEQTTVAHELGHALTDAALGFPDLRPQPLRADAQMAERSLIEGDATLLMQHYAMTEFPDEVEEALTGSASPEQQQQAELLPYILKRSFSFPYNEGYLFACALFARGGWEMVDRAYEEPPRATLEILYPDLYGEFDIELPVPPRPPGEGWEKASTFQIGAADLQWMFEAPGGEFQGSITEAARQVSRWRGGRFHVWTRGDDMTLAMSIVEGRDLSGAAPLTICHRLVRWYSQSFPEAGFVDGRGAEGAWENDGDTTLVECEGRQVRLVVAPDDTIARRVARF